jgi:hypothetical protein
MEEGVDYEVEAVKARRRARHGKAGGKQKGSRGSGGKKRSSSSSRHHRGGAGSERRGVVEWEYLIKWKGYPPEQNSWEPASNLTANSLRQQFDAAETARQQQSKGAKAWSVDTS